MLKEGRGLQTKVTLQAGDNLWGPAGVTAPPACTALAPRGPRERSLLSPRRRCPSRGV